MLWGTVNRKILYRNESSSKPASFTLCNHSYATVYVYTVDYVIETASKSYSASEILQRIHPKHCLAPLRLQKVIGWLLHLLSKWKNETDWTRKPDYSNLKNFNKKSVSIKWNESLIEMLTSHRKPFDFLKGVSQIKCQLFLKLISRLNGKLKNSRITWFGRALCFPKCAPGSYHVKFGLTLSSDGFAAVSHVAWS